MKNKLSQAIVQVGGLIVGNGPSAGGKGAVGTTGTPKTVKSIRFATATVTPTASILTQTVDVQTVTITGVKAGDVVIPLPPTNLETSLQVSACFVSANDTVTLRLGNCTAGTITTAAKSWSFLWLQMA